MNLSFKYNITSTLFSILFAALSVQAQVTSSQIDSLVSVAMSDFNVAGLAIGVVQDGKIIHSKGYGYANAETKKPVT